MMHCCQFCGRAFSRKFDRDRHKAAHCSKRFDDKEGMTSFSSDEESIEQRPEKYYEDDDEGNNSTEDGDEADDHDDDKEEDDGGEETENGETRSDTENDDVDPWVKQREEAINDLNSTWEEEVQENLRQGLQKDDAEIQFSHRLLPVYRTKLRHLYLQYLRWYHDLKSDPVHEKVMKTLRSFMEDNEMHYTEAVEAAISKQRYLLNSLFDLEQFPLKTRHQLKMTTLHMNQ